LQLKIYPKSQIPFKNSTGLLKFQKFLAEKRSPVQKLLAEKEVQCKKLLAEKISPVQKLLAAKEVQCKTCWQRKKSSAKIAGRERRVQNIFPAKKSST